MFLVCHRPEWFRKLRLVYKGDMSEYMTEREVDINIVHASILGESLSSNKNNRI